MTAYPEMDPTTVAILSASEQLRQADEAFDATPYEQSSVVIETVNEALRAAEVRGAPGVQQLLQRYTAETVALGSLIRASREESPLTGDEIDRIKEFFEFILNDIFRR